MNIRPSRRRTPRCRIAANRGVVLLEALVAILIFTIGVIGLIGVQAAMTKAQTQANFRTEAAQLASDVVGRMWVDTQKIDSYIGDAACKAYAPCNNWRTLVMARMPGGVPPTLTRNGEAIDIVVTWVLPGETDDGGKHNFKTTTSVSPQPKGTP